MEARTRQPFEGIANVVRFNRHFYVVALAVAIALFVSAQFVSGYAKAALLLMLLLLLTGTFLSLAVSFYVYDLSGLYKFNWLPLLSVTSSSTLVNIIAGFDETSYLLARKYRSAQLVVFDFYKPEQHTEISIARARKRYPPYPGTLSVSTTKLPLKNESADAVFAILSAHEIRNQQERVAFFAELNSKLKPDGTIIVAEHVRDAANFIAYNIGFFHFFSGKEWRYTFRKAGLSIVTETSVTPFIHVFILQTHGIAL